MQRDRESLRWKSPLPQLRHGLASSDCHVSAHQQGGPGKGMREGGGLDAGQLLGLPDSAVRNFVLDNDPVPRALLSVDPSFSLLKKVLPARLPPPP